MTTSSDEAKARAAIVDVGSRMWQQGLVSANDGNISVRLDDARVLCTPTGISKGRMRESDLCIVAMNGDVIDRGTGRGPSSEIRMHLGVYDEDPEVRAVVHAHPPFSTLAAIRARQLDAALLPEIVVALPRVPVAPYATPSTDEVPASVRPFVREGPACLLEQHGALTWATDLESAYLTMERVEYFARMVHLLEASGGVRTLEQPKIDALHERFGLT